MSPIAPPNRNRPWIPKKEEQKNQGRFQRSKEYDSPRWRKARLRFLQLHPLCVECEKTGKITEAKVLDHIKQVRMGADFWDENNWQPLCNHHHSVKSARERYGK